MSSLSRNLVTVQKSAPNIVWVMNYDRTVPIGMAELAERVASPGGTTRAGLDILDQHAALKKLVDQTLGAAIHRAEEMAREAREN